MLGGKKREIIFLLCCHLCTALCSYFFLYPSLLLSFGSLAFFLSLVRYIDQHVDCVINNLLFSRPQTVISTNEPAQSSHCSFSLCVCVYLYLWGSAYSIETAKWDGKNIRRKKKVLVIVLIITITIMYLFIYFHYFNENVKRVLWLHCTPHCSLCARYWSKIQFPFF